MKETLEKAYESIEAELASMEEVFEELLESGDPRLQEFVRHFDLYRGKRLRPALVFLFGRSFGPVDQRHVHTAAAAELLHVATLIHDDILDEASVRRNRRTANTLFGNELSVLLGDWVLTASLQAAGRVPEEWVMPELVAAAREVCQGEMLQICHRRDLSMDQERYVELTSMKTGALFGFCCAAGARLSGADSAQSAKLKAFGRNLGIAFQIVDDCLDVTGNEEKAGKSLGTDIEKGKMTLPVIRAFATLRGAARSELEAGFLDGNRSGDVRRRIGEAQVIPWCEDRARDFASAALDLVDSLDGLDLRARLSSLAEFTLGRSW